MMFGVEKKPGRELTSTQSEDISSFSLRPSHEMSRAVFPASCAALAITGASEIHFAARVPTPSAMRFRRADMYMGGELRPAEYDRLDTTSAAVAAVITAATRARR